MTEIRGMGEEGSVREIRDREKRGGNGEEGRNGEKREEWGGEGRRKKQGQKKKKKQKKVSSVYFKNLFNLQLCFEMFKPKAH